MRRDFELIRLILFDLEGHEPVDLTSYTDDQIKYHQVLIVEAGLAEGSAKYPSYEVTDVPSRVIIKRLTWDGHEFLDKARSEKVWDRAKSIILSKGLSLSFEALKIAMSEVVKTLIT